MRRFPPILFAVLAALPLLRAAPAVAALPADAARDGISMVDGPVVHDVVTNGPTVWLGGRFSQVEDATGAFVAPATSLAVLTRDGPVAGRVHRALPRLRGTNPLVYDLAVAPNGIVYVAGKFQYVRAGKTYRNLIAIDGEDGSIDATFRVPELRSVAVAYGSVYAGGRKLWRLSRNGGRPDDSFHSMQAYIDPSLRGHVNKPRFRGIVSTGDGDLIVAGQFDWIDRTSSAGEKKVAVKVDAETGVPDLGDGSWSVQCLCARQSGLAFGLAVHVADGVAYVAAGGNDWVAAVRVANGALIWQTDANGSVQDLTVYDATTLVIGGHWTYLEDAGPSDESAGECPSRGASSADPCWEQPRLAAVARSDGLPRTGWTPTVCCRYRGVWATTVRGATLHVGGEFTTLDPDPGPERFYGRFRP